MNDTGLIDVDTLARTYHQANVNVWVSATTLPYPDTPANWVSTTAEDANILTDEAHRVYEYRYNHRRTGDNGVVVVIEDRMFNRMSPRSRGRAREMHRRGADYGVRFFIAPCGLD